MIEGSEIDSSRRTVMIDQVRYKVLGSIDRVKIVVRSKELYDGVE